jgi:serine/threonine protein kinase
MSGTGGTQPARSNLNEVLLGVWDFGRDTMDTLAESITCLEKKVVPIIPFGMISIDTTLFFSGGTARVYRGKYGNEDVAVKLLFCLELTPERVKEFCGEATLLNSVQHENVVKCHGVSVMPPAICLITEFCDHGSLYDLMHASDFVINHHTPLHNKKSRATAASSAAANNSVSESQRPTALATGGVAQQAAQLQRDSGTTRYTFGSVASSTGTGVGNDRISGYTFGGSVVADSDQGGSDASTTSSVSAINRALLQSEAEEATHAHAHVYGSTSSVGGSDASAAAASVAMSGLHPRDTPESSKIATGGGSGEKDDDRHGDGSLSMNRLLAMGGGEDDDNDSNSKSSQAPSWQSHSDLCMSLVGALESRPGSTRSSFSAGAGGPVLPSNPLHSSASHLINTMLVLGGHGGLAHSNEGDGDHHDPPSDDDDGDDEGDNDDGSHNSNGEIPDSSPSHTVSVETTMTDLSSANNRESFYSADAGPMSSMSGDTTNTRGGSLSTMERMGLQVSIIRRTQPWPNSTGGGGDHESQQLGIAATEVSSSTMGGATDPPSIVLPARGTSTGSRSDSENSGADSEAGAGEVTGPARGGPSTDSTAAKTAVNTAANAAASKSGGGGGHSGQGRKALSKLASIMRAGCEDEVVGTEIGCGGKKGGSALDGAVSPNGSVSLNSTIDGAKNTDSSWVGGGFSFTRLFAYSGSLFGGADNNCASSEPARRASDTRRGNGDKTEEALVNAAHLHDYGSDIEGGGGMLGQRQQSDVGSTSRVHRLQSDNIGANIGEYLAGTDVGLQPAGSNNNDSSVGYVAPGTDGAVPPSAFSREGSMHQQAGFSRPHSAAPTTGHRSEHHSSVSVKEVLPVSLRLRLARDCAAGVAHLHASGIMHNDIKSLNFLVDRNLRVKLADLGESRKIPQWTANANAETAQNTNANAGSGLDKANNDSGSTGSSKEGSERGSVNSGSRGSGSGSGSGSGRVSGGIHDEDVVTITSRSSGAGSGYGYPSLITTTPPPPKILPQNINWSAPEVLSGEQDVSASADVWSLSLVISEILTGEVPFDSAEYRKLSLSEFLVKLESGSRPALPPVVAIEYPWLVDLLHRGWAFKWQDRCTSIEMVAELEAQLGMVSGGMNPTPPRSPVKEPGQGEEGNGTSPMRFLGGASMI